MAIGIGMQPEYISLKNLSLKAGTKPVLNTINQNIGNGECVAIIGANGSGKTTLLQALCGILQPNSGLIHIDGHNYQNQRQALKIKQELGYAPDQPPIYPNDTVHSYLKFIAHLKAIPKSLISARIDNSLDIFALGDLKNTLLGTLSKGTQQRVNLAQAIINEPKLLLLDEPTNALDVDQCENLVKFLQELKTRNVTVIIASHHYTEILPICDYMLKLNSGKLEKIYTPLATQEIVQTNDQIHYTT